ncbi:MAG: metal-dependent hydrolase [Chloroflexi bacterium]|nr:metal-dependent hydrolase [Chloroflexota bacterium]
MPKSVKWLGHSCFLITSPKGKRLVVDPWIAGNPCCPLKLEDLPKIDAVLVTHDHFDHSSNAVDIAKRFKSVVLAQPETIGRMQSEGGLPAAQAVYGMGMNTGGSAAIDGITVTMVEAHHSSQTGSPAGYVIKLEDGTTLYHAGDTGIFGGMQLLAELFPVDLAMLPIGGVFTMDSLQAAKALTLLKPKMAMPMHYKTFPVLEQSADNFVTLAKEEAPNVKVIVLEPGKEHSW